MTAHGICRLTHGGKFLTVTTQRKRGKLTKPHVETYVVEDVRPDPRVANPAYSLTKSDGTVWHVAVNEFGPTCDCPHATYRGHNNPTPCKHSAACGAVGLLRRKP